MWPLSRKKSPKQFERIIGEQSTLQYAVERLTKEIDPSDIFIATGRAYRDVVESQLPQIPRENIIFEPVMRDVGPAVGLIAAIFSRIAPDESVAILWGADHLVKKDDVFRKLLKAADEVIEKEPETIVYMGHLPRFPNQNLGWIEYEKNVTSQTSDFNVHQLSSFKYRPPLELCEQYVTDGKHAWNLGYFMVKPKFLWKLFADYAPELYRELEKIQSAYGTLSYGRVLEQTYPNLEKISFDHAILEKMPVEQGRVIVADIGWSDVGAWEALKESLEGDKKDVVTKGNVITEGCVDGLVMDYEGKKLVVAVDLEDILIVNTNDVLLVTKKSSASKTKKLVEGFEGTKYDELT